MKRHLIEPRKNWQATVESQGFEFHSNGLRPSEDTASHWREDIYYEFTLAEVEEIEAATKTLYDKCLCAVDHVVKTHDLKDFEVPSEFIDGIKSSWYRDDPSLYGRFDLAYNGTYPPKLLEFNADTPTCLIESAVVQWWWMKDKFPELDQFNSIHERLIEQWKSISRFLPKDGYNKIHFSSIKESHEEFSTVEYIRDTANQAGLNTEFVYMSDIGFTSGDEMVGNRDTDKIKYWFKLYPWEWLMYEPFAQKLAKNLGKIGIIEPSWKVLLSNKRILTVLHKLFPDHPNILPSWDYQRKIDLDLISKPCFGREGKNITMNSVSTSGPYDGPRVWQRRANTFNGETYNIIGSWVVGSESAGMIIREDDTPIVMANSRIVPHVIRG